MRHGHPSTYRKHGCHCDDCRAAVAAEMRDYRKRRHLARGSVLLNPTGIVRRLEALAVMGWGVEEIAARLDMTPSAVARLRKGEHRALPKTAAAIAAIYDELSMTVGPSRKARAWAKRRGWLGPLHWDDDTIDDPGAWAQPGEDTDPGIDPVVVDRLAAGADWTTLGATRGERLAAADAMLRRGHGVAEVEHHLSLRAGRDFRRGVAS